MPDDVGVGDVLVYNDGGASGDVTYFFDDYDTGEAWDNSPQNINDSIASHAWQYFDGRTQLLNSNSRRLDSTNYGTITKVELRVHGGNCEDSLCDDMIILRPVFGGTTNGANYEVDDLPCCGTGPCDSGLKDWTAWHDITNDDDAPLWTWGAVEALDCDVVKSMVGGAADNTLASKVEIRVTYSSGSDQLAFIHGRTDATTYTVKDKDGNAPTETSGYVAVEVYRAYESLANWQSQTENDDINDNDVDPNKNLTTANTILNVACYGDGPDSTVVTITDWTTDADRYLKIYTPVSSSEVGVSQRHNGAWDDSKYRIESANIAPIRIGQNDSGVAYLTIEGLQIYLSGVSSNGYAGIRIRQTSTANHRISNNIIKSVTHASYVYAGIYNYVVPSGSEARIWNNIIYGFDGPAGRGIYNFDPDATAYVYNNAVYNCYIGYSASVGQL